MVVIDILELSVLATIKLDCKYAQVFTQSTKTSCVPSESSLIGFCPQVTSRRNMPNAKTSVRVVAFPLCTSSGAKYPIVPTTCVLFVKKHIVCLDIMMNDNLIPFFMEPVEDEKPRIETIDIDPNMIIVDIPKLIILDGIELNGKKWEEK
uniref:Uncharacterized protein n=1 Tax=Leersia perrieri TaxID=77586 RepID=A0A0D9WV80_9ORYZ